MLSERIQELLMLIHKRRWGGFRGAVLAREHNAEEEKELAAIRDEVAALEQRVEDLEEALVDLGDSFRGDRNFLLPNTIPTYAKARDALAAEEAGESDE